MSIAKSWGFDAANGVFSLAVGESDLGHRDLLFRFENSLQHDSAEECVFVCSREVTGLKEHLSFKIGYLPKGTWVRCRIFEQDKLIDSCSCRVVPDVGDMEKRIASLEGIISILRDHVAALADAHGQLPSDIRSDVGFGELDAAIAGLVEYHQGLGSV